MAEIKVNQLAILFDVTERYIQRLAKDGVIIKTKRGFYDLAGSVRGYIKFLRDAAEGKSVDLEEQKKRLYRLRADKAQIEIDLAKAEVINVDEAMKAWGQVVMIVRSRILAIPKKTAPLMVGIKRIAEAEDILKRVTNETLRELASPDLIDRALGVQKEKRERGLKRKK
ncbi:MAG TPA: hypothetical protein VMV77_14240 [Bacteroidales bacterium]|nr:hypothetical protein [Bacteroidales bacterium]